MCMKFQWHNDDNDGDADDIHSLLTWIPIQITVLKNLLNFENMCHNVRNEIRYALKKNYGIICDFFQMSVPHPFLLGISTFFADSFWLFWKSLDDIEVILGGCEG